MDEDFQEADVVWPEPDSSDHRRVIQTHADLSKQGRPRRRRLRRRKSSVPVDIPARPVEGLISSSSTWQLNFVHRPDVVAADADEDTDGSSNGSSWETTIPPHLVLVARRTSSEQTELSVCTGKGRTLKGRDLQRVRNSILRMTGFLEE